ncbi:prepilin-type N-terminal cleavage/methylation domain-containing protein [Desulfitispora alkaliphila]|uniref:type II secretion system protein n=1 Tax=Desulfitispora alkaliphila TaxID=622674 RepID=UPI003D230B15
MMRAFRKKNKNNKGFTLVELLVVIAIIGILAAVIAPAVFEQIDKSRAARVIGDYNSVRTAMTAYYADKGEYANSFDELVDNNKLDATPEYSWVEETDAVKLITSEDFIHEEDREAIYLLVKGLNDNIKSILEKDLGKRYYLVTNDSHFTESDDGDVHILIVYTESE